MKKRFVVKLLIGLALLITIVMIVAIFFVEPWIKNKIEAELNKNNIDYRIEIRKVNLLFFYQGIDLQHISIIPLHDGAMLNAEIRSVKLLGIDLSSLYNKDNDIRELRITDSNIKTIRSSRNEKRPSPLSPLNIRIGKLVIEKMNLVLGDSSSAQLLTIREGELRIENIVIAKQDTLSPRIIKNFDLDVQEFSSLSADSMYTLQLNKISYKGNAGLLTIGSFSVEPSYKGYDFTSRFRYETNCFEAAISDITIYDISAADYFASGSIASSYVTIGKLDLKAFRDKRKEFRHVNKKVFQQLIYDFPGRLRIDTLEVIKGSVEYIEHAEGANEAGKISFTELSTKICNITNDTALRNEKGFLVWKSNALLMGKGKLNVLLRSPLFDLQHTFTVSGSLGVMDAPELNPILEINGFVYVNSGKINEMNFDFTADDTKSKGKMTLLYNNLDLTIKNKVTDDTIAFREKFISYIVNTFVINANPQPRQEVREGTIDYQRDPERFLFNYCVKSIVSGLKSSITSVRKNKEKKSNKSDERAKKKLERTAEKKKRKK
ncbi:MAG: hypothetical protein M3Q56_00225 [Bacteroidota bacterium]|nr:hypothetical protein [Bacteroidota bacterium]